jgi:hypothetical protein
MFTNSKRKRAVAQLEAAIADIKSRRPAMPEESRAPGWVGRERDRRMIQELDLRLHDPKVQVRLP